MWRDRKRRVRDRQSFDVSLQKGRQEVWEFVSLRIVSCFRFEEPLSLRKQDTFPAGQAQNVFNVPPACKAVIAGQAGMLMYDTSRRGIRENADANQSQETLFRELIAGARPARFLKVPQGILDYLLAGQPELVLPKSLAVQFGYALAQDLQDSEPGQEVAESSPAPASSAAGVNMTPGSELALEWDTEINSRGIVIRRAALTDMGKLAYSLQATDQIKDVVATVLRMTGAIPANNDSMDPSKARVRCILLKLDCLHSLSRRIFCKAGRAGVCRYLSADSSPQANYDYLVCAEEILTHHEEDSITGYRVPLKDDGSINPWGGFVVEKRSLVVGTIARGESSAAAKMKRVLHMICLEYGVSDLDKYRYEVRGVLTDQGTERLICKHPLDTADNVKRAMRSLDPDFVVAGSAAARNAARGIPFFPVSLELPGALHVIFNTLEACVKHVDEFAKFHKQMSAICHYLTDMSYQEIIAAKMLQGCPAYLQILADFRDNLLDFRWDSRRLVLDQWRPLRKVLLEKWRPEEIDTDAAEKITEILQDEFHGWMACWAQSFAASATHIAHWFEGCYCHEELLTAEASAMQRRKAMRKETGSPTCVWKGRRLAQLAAGHLDTLLRQFSHESIPRYVAEMLIAPGEVQARLVAVDLEARQQLGAVLQQKFACAQSIPWVLTAAFAGYAGVPWTTCKAAVRSGFEQYSNAANLGTLMDAVSHKAFSLETVESRQLQQFATAADSELHMFPHAFKFVQEYSFCSVAERSAERQHVDVKQAARRGLRYAGPAMVCARKRKRQVLKMIEDPASFRFLLEHWRSRCTFQDLLGHVLEPTQVRRLSLREKLARVYGYDPKDHFMDLSDSTSAQAAYQSGLLKLLDRAGASLADAPAAAHLSSAAFQVVLFLKGHLCNGALVSMGDDAFQHAVRFMPRQDTENDDVPCATLSSQDLKEGLQVQHLPRIQEMEPHFFTVIDAYPERRADVRGRHAAGLDRSRSTVVVMVHGQAHMISDQETIVDNANDRRVVLELASFCSRERLQLFVHSTRIWSPTAAGISVQLLAPQAVTALQGVQPFALPEFVEENAHAAPMHVLVERDLGLQQQAVVPNGADKVLPLQVAAAGLVVTPAEQDVLQELLRHNAVDGQQVSVDDMRNYSQAVQENGMLAVGQGLFSEMTLCIKANMRLFPKRTWANPL